MINNLSRKYVCLTSFLLVLLFLFFIFIGLAFSNEINYPKNLWKGLFGEAVGEGYEGMYVVACVYRNRLKADISLGCVALKNKDKKIWGKNHNLTLDEFIFDEHRRVYGDKYEYMAKSVVEKVFCKDGKDITQGSTHYDNIEAFGTPYWAKEMIVVCKIGNHTFYKKEE